MGALIGAAIDRGDGDSGIKGVIIGTVAESAIRGLAPIVATYALGWAVQYGVRKGWHAIVGADPIDAGTGRRAEDRRRHDRLASRTSGLGVA